MSSLDYRLLNAMNMDSYYHPINNESDRKIQTIWE